MSSTPYFRHGNGAVENASFTCDTLPINDGFKDAFDFFRWFSKDFTGQLIHWSDLRY